jgi:hypothetical protein
MISLLFILGSSYITGYSTNINVNTSEIDNSSSMELTSVYDLGSAFSRFFAFVGFGVGLPSDTPLWFNVIFIIWQSLLFMFVLGFLYQSIRGG